MSGGAGGVIWLACHWKAEEKGGGWPPSLCLVRPLTGPHVVHLWRPSLVSASIALSRRNLPAHRIWRSPVSNTILSHSTFLVPIRALSILCYYMLLCTPSFKECVPHSPGGFPLVRCGWVAENSGWGVRWTRVPILANHLLTVWSRESYLPSPSLNFLTCQMVLE